MANDADVVTLLRCSFISSLLSIMTPRSRADTEASMTESPIFKDGNGDLFTNRELMWITSVLELFSRTLDPSFKNYLCIPIYMVKSTDLFKKGPFKKKTKTKTKNKKNKWLRHRLQIFVFSGLVIGWWLKLWAGHPVPNSNLSSSPGNELVIIGLCVCNSAGHSHLYSLFKNE